MSGYLQRMASSVIEPASAVHPVVGSRWAPSRARESEIISIVAADRGSAPLEEDVLPERFRAARVTGRMEAFLPLLSARRPEANLDTGQEDARDYVEASVSRRREEEASRSQPIFTPLLQMDARESVRRRHSEETSHSQPVLTPQVAAATRSRAAEDPIRGNNRTDHGLRRALRTQPAAQPAAVPDEIQIHIGRIEVTATPPAPAVERPAARSPRKSLDLGEYLKRDRRAR